MVGMFLITLPYIIISYYFLKYDFLLFLKSIFFSKYILIKISSIFFILRSDEITKVENCLITNLSNVFFYYLTD